VGLNSSHEGEEWILREKERIKEDKEI